MSPTLAASHTFRHAVTRHQLEIFSSFPLDLHFDPGVLCAVFSNMEEFSIYFINFYTDLFIIREHKCII